MITSSALEQINQFNKIGLHYNLVADAVYALRNSAFDPFGSDYMPYIIAALVSFDIGRMMGPDAKSRYDRKAGGFATFLDKKVNMIKPYISHLANLRLVSLSPRSEEGNI